MVTRLTTLQIVSQIKSELDRLLGGEAEAPRNLPEAPVTPVRIDIVETTANVCLLVELPGVAAADLEVTVAGNRVTVAGDKIAPGPTSQACRFLCVERQWGRFERSVDLPATVDPRAGRALLDHGVLRVEFPILQDQRNQLFRLRVETADGEPIE